MNATKILWVQVLLVCATVLGFIWAATEWTAWQLAFQPQLGQPWFELFGWPMYQPPAFFWWWFAYDAYAHESSSPAASSRALAASLRSSWRSPCRCGARAK